MEIINYTEEHKQFRHRLKNFLAKEVIPNIEKWERDEITPKSIWAKLGKNGFLCTDVPQEYGGMGGDFLYSVIVCEEIAYSTIAGLLTYLHSDIIVPYISTFGSEEQKKKYLSKCVSGDIITAVAMTEPGAGSDLASLCTTAEDDGDHVVINGSKTFISNGINCDLVIVAAKDPAIENSYKAISLYLVEDGTPGFEKGQNLEKLGLHSQDTAELFFSKCRIPKSNLLGEKGKGFYMLMQKLQQERLMITINALASGEFILEETIEYCKKTKDQGGLLAQNQSVQFKLVEMATDIKIGRTFIDKLIAEHMEGKDVNTETSMAKFWVTEMANKVADRSLDLYGYSAWLEKCSVVRPWRDLRGTPIFGGTSQIMRKIIAKSMGL